MLKRVIRSRVGLFCLSITLAAIITLLMISIRWRHENKAYMKTVLANQTGLIVVFWHERILSMPWLWPHRHAMNALQSPHPDGRLLAYTVNQLGVKTVWGSSNRNALSGLRGLKRVLDDSKIAAITPDGPRGPAKTAAAGPVALAALSEKPILPVAWSVDRYWRAPGWDAMIIPKPFARGTFHFGDVVTLPKPPSKQEMERQRLAVEAAINDVTDKADAHWLQS